MMETPKARLAMGVLIILGMAVLTTVPAAAQDYALERLEKSPRHHEWVAVESGDRIIHSFVVYPEKKEDALAVIVIHENRGLTDWVRSLADQLAEAGFLAIAPDLLSGFDEEHDRTSAFESSDDARNAIYKLDADQVTADLLAVQNYIAGAPGSNGATCSVGFCWGGSQSFRLATNANDLAAALVFYGTGPTDSTAYNSIEAQVHGFYGGNDQRVNSTIIESRLYMKTYGKHFEYEIYEDAGHAYMRRGDDPDGSEANRKARDSSWIRMTQILAQFQ
jgi:carboxymethylenebutenolidase